MLQIGNKVHVPASQVAPRFFAISPNEARRLELCPLVEVIAVRASFSCHEGASGALLVANPVFAVTDAQLKILQVLVLIHVDI